HRGARSPRRLNQIRSTPTGTIPASAEGECGRRSRRPRKETPVRRSLALVTLALMAVASRPASASNLDVRFAAFFPRAESILYRVDAKSDFDRFYGGAEFSFKVARNVELGFHVDGFGKGVNTHYRDYTRPNGGEIFQTLHLEEIPIGFSIRIVPTSRHAKVAP